MSARRRENQPATGWTGNAFALLAAAERFLRDTLQRPARPAPRMPLPVLPRHVRPRAGAGRLPATAWV